MNFSFLLPLDSLPAEFQPIPFVKRFNREHVALGLMCPGCCRCNTLFAATDSDGEMLALWWCSECAQIFVQAILRPE